MDTDEEEYDDDDVEFWGGESLSSRAGHLLPHSRRTGRRETGRSGRRHEEDAANDFDDDDDDDHDNDEDDIDDDDDEDDDASTSDDNEADGDWETDAEGDGDEEDGDPMEIFGHR